MSSSLLISTQSIRKSFGAHPLFTDVSINFLEGECLGLIGPNGSGKSTLLKMLAGIEEPDSGRISRKRNLSMVYLPQTDIFESGETIRDVFRRALSVHLEEWDFNKRIQEMKTRLELDDLSQSVHTLSGGWRKRLAIGRALLQAPDLLLMDEPTNHLDLEGILWLEKLLQNPPFAFVLVSHDRFFLEHTTNRMVELNRRYPEGFFKVEGRYSEFVQKREKYFQEQAQKEAVLSNKVRREVDWLQRGPKARTTKAQYRIDQAHQLQEDLGSVKTRNAQHRTVQIDFDATGRKRKKLLEAQHLKMVRNGKVLFDGLDILLSPGTCLGVLGRNGSGKTSLLHLLNGRLTPDAGTVQFAEGLQMVTFDQQRELLDPNQTLRQSLSPEGDHVMFRGRSYHVMAWAKRFLFPGDQLGMPVHKLSGGETARLLIANLMRQPADVLFLDEPTNDLDIPTLEILEESLEEFAGAIVLITHDRFLMNRLSDRLLYLDGEGGWEYFADYDQWLQYRETRAASVSISPTRVQLERKKTGKQIREAQKELARLEKKIEKADVEVATLKGQLHDPEIMSDAERLAEIYRRIQEVEAAAEELYLQWEALDDGVSDHH